MFGGKSGQKAANEAAAAQRASNAAAYSGARSASGQGYGQADSILSGYEAPGREAYGLYADSTGAGGTAGYNRAFQSFSENPFHAGANESTNRMLQGMFRRYNAGGMGNSGANRAALSLTNSQLYDQRVGDWQNRLGSLGQQGAQFGMARAGNAVDHGNRLADYSIGEHTGYGNIESQRIGNVYQAKQQGMNNMLNVAGMLGGSAIKGFAPTASGVSAFGNMSNALAGKGWV